jgi:hypothetical protein
MPLGFLSRIPRRRLFDWIAAALSLSAFAWACWPDSSVPRAIGEVPLPVVRAAAGCWQFDKGEQFVVDRVPAGSVVQLDSAVDDRLSSSEKAFEYRVRVLPFDSANQRSSRLSGWAVDSTDEQLILLWIGDGFTGASFRLRLRDARLTGTLRGYADVPSFSFRHSVGAHRVACPS